MSIHTHIADLLPSNLRLLKPTPGSRGKNITKICTLWAGYGGVYRVPVRDVDVDVDGRGVESVVVKIINIPEREGGGGGEDGDEDEVDEGHVRKLVSYVVERWFYEECGRKGYCGGAGEGGEGGGVQGWRGRVARCFAPRKGREEREAGGEESGEKEGGGATEGVLILQDLTLEYPVPPWGSINDIEQAQAVIRWLAAFHVEFWCDCSNPQSLPTIPPPKRAMDLVRQRKETGTMEGPSSSSSSYTDLKGVWEKGSYWYLETRQQEYDDVCFGRDPEWDFITKWAGYVNRRLWPSAEQPTAEDVNIGTIGRTLIHGDAKAANILFSHAPEKTAPSGPGQVRAALYDFQYVGYGLGVLDLVYFLSTSVSPKLLGEGPVSSSGSSSLLEMYHTEVDLGLRKRGVDPGEYTYDVFVEQFQLAIVDWMRFMAGWGTWGNARWVERAARSAVELWEGQGRDPER